MPDSRVYRGRRLQLVVGSARAVHLNGISFLQKNQDRQKSKRSAFRFRCSKEPVTYRTDYEEGEALLTNISTEGCALEWATNPPRLHEKMLISIALEDEEAMVEIKTEVVRAEGTDFAVKFLLIEPDTKSLIRTYFSRKLRGKR
jgi:hypothetical protein